MKRSGFLKRPDCSIYYETAGSGPAMVFAHGLCSQALAALAPSGRAVCVPQSGHSVYFERPTEFNRIVDEFLKST